ncbi:HD domain-containing protein [Psychrilyobacter atlanticus]|uniref:HD domain-containing protein n=1 Tax=Psychrilyobacter atlanticus TaxID=271091 RepID=UPI00041C0A48|nr:HD domain-containing protein [Psychrilyobacter atlanticus]
MLEYKEILEILEEVAEKNEKNLKMILEEKLNERERKVFKWLFKEYEDLSKRRWFDPHHIIFSTNFALSLVEEENLDRLIVTAIILHDIGYFAIADKKNWINSNSRIIHMQEGAALASKILYEHGFNPKEVEKVVGMIAVHDNPYIGIPIIGDDRLGLRDCDRAWVMHPLSFYKDLSETGRNYENPKELLLDRVVQFYSHEHPFDRSEWKIDLQELKDNGMYIEKPAYEFTKQYIEKQFKVRIMENNDMELLSNRELFTKYLEENIINSMKGKI